jgi:hypothetical protein
MATINIQLPRSEYASLQVGDILYSGSLDSDTSGGFSTLANNPGALGAIKAINNTTSLSDGTLTTTITLDIPDSMSPPTTSSYLLFKKDATVNTTSLLGYYGSAKFINNSTDKVELFATACEINESSK